MKAQKKYKRTKVGSYPYLSVIFSTTLALFLLGLFGMLLINTNKLVEYIQENLEMQVYLNSNVTENQANRLQSQLSEKDYVLHKGDSALMNFISKEDAAEDLIAQTGEDFLTFLGDNPLRDAITFKIAIESQDSSQLNTIKEELEAMPEVYEVTYIESMAQVINKNRTKIAIALAVGALLLLFTISTLINNTIRLALFSQRFLIRSMQLVGATQGFIIRPFITRASLYGLISGLLAGGLLAALLTYALRALPELELVQDQEKTLILFGALLLVGIFIALFSTLYAVRKYLKMSLDELY
ncbi:cell division protein FtsX [Fulvivirgaceae bacterium LMO-SS25]